MNTYTKRLERHIIDTVKEWQMKIGYQEESMGLYYPAVSLINLLGLDKNTEEAKLKEALHLFAAEVKDKLGELAISNNGDRYCLEIPLEGCRYVAEHIPDSDFLRKLLDALGKKGTDMETVTELFESYAILHGGRSVTQDRTDEGLGEVFFFDKEEIDPYIYCIEQDDFGITYHRFDRVDYEKLVSEDEEVKHDTQECIMCR